MQRQSLGLGLRAGLSRGGSLAAVGTRIFGVELPREVSISLVGEDVRDEP